MTIASLQYLGTASFNQINSINLLESIRQAIGTIICTGELQYLKDGFWPCLWFQLKQQGPESMWRSVCATVAFVLYVCTVLCLRLYLLFYLLQHVTIQFFSWTFTYKISSGKCTAESPDWPKVGRDSAMSIFGKQ